MKWILLGVAIILPGFISAQDPCGSMGCEHDCNVVDGKAVCSCEDVFDLDSNGRTCTERLCETEGCPLTTTEPAFVCQQVNKDKINCSCPVGYLLHKTRKYCVKDLCTVDNNGCQERCEYLEDQDRFQCSCDVSWEVLDPTGKKCIAKDLCQNNNGGCEHACQIVRGGVKCSCRAGMVLQRDRRSCRPASQNFCDAVPKPCDHICENLGTKAKCSCRVGFELNTVTNKCDDTFAVLVGPMRLYLTYKNINYCAVENGGCAHSCVSTLFGKRCVCDTGYTGNPAMDGLPENSRCTKIASDWTSTHTIIVVIVLIIILILLIIICCCCSSWKNLRENICCKSFVSWKCCMTGCFCKCNEGEASDTTALHYHDVSINVKNYVEDYEEDPEKL